MIENKIISIVVFGDCDKIQAQNNIALIEKYFLANNSETLIKNMEEFLRNFGTADFFGCFPEENQKISNIVEVRNMFYMDEIDEEMAYNYADSLIDFVKELSKKGMIPDIKLTYDDFLNAYEVEVIDCLNISSTKLIKWILSTPVRDDFLNWAVRNK